MRAATSTRRRRGRTSCPTRWRVSPVYFTAARRDGGTGRRSSPPTTMAAACEIGAYLIPHAVAAIGVLHEDPTTGLARRIVAWLRDHGWPATFNLREVYRSLNVEAVDAGKAAALLAGRGWIRPVGQRGRPVVDRRRTTRRTRTSLPWNRRHGEGKRHRDAYMHSDKLTERGGFCRFCHCLYAPHRVRRVLSGWRRERRPTARRRRVRLRRRRLARVPVPGHEQAAAHRARLSRRHERRRHRGSVVASVPARQHRRSRPRRARRRRSGPPRRRHVAALPLGARRLPGDADDRDGHGVAPLVAGRRRASCARRRSCRDGAGSS